MFCNPQEKHLLSEIGKIQTIFTIKRLKQLGSICHFLSRLIIIVILGKVIIIFRVVVFMTWKVIFMAWKVIILFRNVVFITWNVFKVVVIDWDVFKLFAVDWCICKVAKKVHSIVSIDWKCFWRVNCHKFRVFTSWQEISLSKITCARAFYSAWIDIKFGF